MNFETDNSMGTKSIRVSVVIRKNYSAAKIRKQRYNQIADPWIKLITEVQLSNIEL